MPSLIIPLFVNPSGGLLKTSGRSDRYTNTVRLPLKRGSDYAFQVLFVGADNATGARLADGSIVKITLKEELKFNSTTVLASAETNTYPESDATPYSLDLSMDTEAIAELMTAAEGSEADAVDSINAEFEVSWTGDDWVTKQANNDRVQALIVNETHQDDDAAPVPSPTSEEWLLGYLEPIELTAPPLNFLGTNSALGLRARLQRELITLTGFVSPSGDIAVSVNCSRSGWATLNLNVAVLNGDNASQVATKIAAALVANGTFNELYDATGNGGGVFEATALVPEDDDPAFKVTIASSLGITGGTTITVQTGIVATPIAYVGKEARCTVGSHVVFFKAATTLHWVGISNGLIYDDNPETGIPRWKIDGWDGVGSGRIFTKIDL